MAHRIAELMAGSERAQGENKAAIDRELQALILELWDKRATLPGNVDPGKRLLGAIGLLEKLEGDDRFYPRQYGEEASIDRATGTALYEVRTLAIQVVLLRIAQNPPHSDEAGLPLSEEEIALREKIDALMNIYARSPVVRTSAGKEAGKKSDCDVLSEKIGVGALKATEALAAISQLLLGYENKPAKPKARRQKISSEPRGRTKI